MGQGENELFEAFHDIREQSTYVNSIDGTILLPTKLIVLFREALLKWYTSNRRSFAWRETDDPYCIYVSEIMLQQTQTARVVPKYGAFIEQFPNFIKLAGASTGELIQAWQGLGYNRRVLNLQKAAIIICDLYNGHVPDTTTALMGLPGIGAGTAGSLLAFVHNYPSVFIETNIRTLFSYLFFPERELIDDKEIMPLIQQTLLTNKPREWYYALMDAGVFLKSTLKLPNSLSRHYRKQSKFKGSRRELRGAVLRELARNGALPLSHMEKCFGTAAYAISEIIDELVCEGFIRVDDQTVSLK